ncbi:RNA 2',3'-cyclic phosphodiesterase [Xanthomonas campestris]|uniref:RNA 2',3'-cyclic phosphodiesterase n=1 Tax=Xanthomonas campestris TaxID=339 RepID=UPI000E329FCB|nr:RNA 2',3'-cyclic phosphodiesterase [Xanthomonas campestris]MCC5066000.1 RNA 2',3'-cyclic phosphodiesterase [Xanthomonas campestris pv. raphani]MCC8485480.1 RNA 2',3'-cyclic phosphodiesterase [Xanthomonas campestris]MEA9649126.1 RNA 2',3'-cyclic phosphodiesterase [Xanthomonas campestris pv. raphani]MEA9706116.1 RNA 2',3'-cyclic phosphodiesterase [Xanthomonas campestris pv. raphani]MEA9709589.1 RNA 2',3'-cyclic phosphodiesterase [Xanthomonas campestris]
MQQQFLYLSSAEAQLSLGLGEEKTTERLFFAVMADAATATHAAQIGSALLQAGLVEGKPLAPERLHVTLHHLGDYAGGLPPSLVARASQAAERAAQQAFEVEFDRVGTFGGRRSQLPCVLRGEEQVRGLYDLQGALGRQLAHVGIAGDAQYTPHMTLLYCNQSLPQRRCDPLRWTVTDFALVRSFLGQSRYQIEGRWSLR